MSNATSELRVLTYNIHKGFSLDRRFVLSSIKAAILSSGANLVFLQEVVGENRRHQRSESEWPLTSQLEFLADEVWPHHVYGKNAVYTDGHHGNAILSQHPIHTVENIDISTNRLERRGLLHVTLDVNASLQNSPAIHAICLHLDLFERGRVAQYERIISRIQEQVPDECPLILAGDFNDWRETATPALQRNLRLTEAYLQLHGRHARSFPAWFPFLPLDRIYVRGFEPVEARCYVEKPWSQLSDHGALFARLKHA